MAVDVELSSPRLLRTCAEVDREDREPGDFALERFVAFWGTRDASLEGRIEVVGEQESRRRLCVNYKACPNKLVGAGSCTWSA